MSGTIHISENSVWSSGSLAYLTVVELTKRQLSSEEMNLLEDVFAPEEQGFPFIALNELDLVCFNIFFDRCIDALREYETGGRERSEMDEFFDGIVEKWNELIRKLKYDTRWNHIKI